MSYTDEMIKRIAAQNEEKRREFENEGARAFKESDRGRAHAARVAAEREAREASEVGFTEAEFFALEVADELGFVDTGDDENPEMIASYAAIVRFAHACRRAAYEHLLTVEGLDPAHREYLQDAINAADARIEELK